MNPEATQQQAATIPETLPLLPLRGMIVFPLAVMPLVVGQERSVKLVDQAMEGNRLLMLVGFQGEANEQPDPASLVRLGTVAVIHQLLRAPDGSLRLLVQGLERARVLAIEQTDPFLVARVEPAPDRSAPTVEAEGLRRAVVDLFRRIVAMSEDLPNELAAGIEGFSDPRQVAYFVASTIPLDFESRQSLLEIDPVEAKLSKLVDLLQRELQVREIGQQITSNTQQRMNKSQREYFLREQLRSIQQELGEGEEQDDLGALRRQVEEAGMPPDVRREADRELSRLASIPSASPEQSMTRNYLEWLASLPWSKTTGGEINVPHARQVLDEDHYDLDRVKQRILDYLAVRKLRQERRRTDTPEEGEDIAATGEPLLCFVGPPGVGKTSLARSISRALGRKLVQISLGGVRDEAEIRGHRRTYIGALPGRIIQGIRRAEAKDPVFVLDEIDKVGADWRGDPSSALLEVLDPAQNHAFVDTYLGVPFDLSQVMFICTANTLDTIPPALLDRMEILQLAGYTEAEKVAIAQQHLIPKQIQSNGLEPGEISFDADAIRAVIRGYTREAGVRGLNRELATICRKVARGIAEGNREPVRVTAANVEEFLERPRFLEEVAERTDRPGVATGLAWTPTGGDVLFVEATMMPAGHQEQLILTGMLGDVMRESAQAALSYVRSNAAALGIDPQSFTGKTIHIHVPAGAIPKDGPSAGVTIVSALASLLTGRPVRSDVAMTGEITLRGKVLPVGGIKEKVLAAHRLGIRKVIIPSRNERDTQEIPEEVRRDLTFIFADTADTVVREALTPAAAETSAR